MNEGWQCPCCKMVYAPFVRFCACQTANKTPGYDAPYGEGLRMQTPEQAEAIFKAHANQYVPYSNR